MVKDGVPADQHGPPPAEAASAETRLKGHVGHLTTQEESALDEFKQLSAKQGFYTPATDTKSASHDDGTLVYAILKPLLHTAKPTLVVTSELGSSSLTMPLSSSKTPRYGAKTTTLTPYMRR